MVIFGYELSEIVLYLAYFYAILFLKKFAFGLYAIILRPRKDLIGIYGKETWALVTGASDGIGKALCEDLAKTGFNIILVARNKAKLDKVADSLRTLNPKISTKVVVFDFSKKVSVDEYKQSFDADLKGLDISILINNVGTGYPNRFTDIPMQEVIDVVNLNIYPQTYLMRLYLERFRQRKNRSAIINVSSYGGQFPLPYYCQYSASKVYSDFLSRSIEYEERDTIDTLSVKPFEVASKLSGHSSYDGFFVISPEACAKGILNALGYDKWTAGGWAHQIQVGVCDFLFSIAPEWFSFWIQSTINKSLIELHKSNKEKTEKSK